MKTKKPSIDSRARAAAPPRKVLRTRGGLMVVLDDQTGQGSVTIVTPGGQRLVLTDGPAAVQVTDANGNSLSLAPAGITINAAAMVTISAGDLEVTAPVAKFGGVVQCDRLIANSVVTPGSGNVW